MEVAHEALGVVPLLEATEVGRPGHLERGRPASKPSWARTWTQLRYSTCSSKASGPHTGPWPGTMSEGSRARRRSSAASARHRAHHHEGSTAVEDEVARVEHTPLGQPAHDVVCGVRGTDVLEVDAGVVDPDVEAALERDERRDLQVPPLHARKRQLRHVPRLEDLLPAELVPDDRRLAAGSCRACGRRGGAC